MKDLMKPDYDNFRHLPHHHHQSLGACNNSRVISMNKKSHVISKVKPKIRVIHIFAPEIIKTDVKNFRPLVQRLTGKPPAGSEGKITGKKRTKPARVSVIGSQESTGHDYHHHQVNRPLIGGGSHVKLGGRGSVGECSNPISNTYFDLEGLIQGFEDHHRDYSSFPMKSSHHHMADGFNVQQQQRYHRM